MRNMNPSNRIFCYVVLVLLLVSGFHQAFSLEIEHEEEFDYTKDSEKGPQHWGDLHEEWAICKNGKMQSPIDLKDERVEVVGDFGLLKRNYKPSHATLKNRGHDIMLEFDDAGSININGTDYFLKQCHWHSPSEHSFNGRRYDLEVHLVHESLDKRIAVVGAMYLIGHMDDFLSELADHIRSISDLHGMESAVGVVDPNHLKTTCMKYYRYMGSLTVPPCTEGVVWTIAKMIKTVSLGQVKLLTEAVRDHAKRNARPLQPINQRDIHLFSSGDRESSEVEP